MTSQRRRPRIAVASALLAAVAVSVPALPALADAPEPWKYDFGTPSSPVASGWTGVHENTIYTEEAGFGIDPESASRISRDRGADHSDLDRDWVAGLGWTFLVDLPNGDYDVTVTMGDLLAGTSTITNNIVLEGEAAGTLSARQEIKSGTYRTTVADGQLTANFNGPGSVAGLVNSIEIVEADEDDSTDPPDPDPTDPPDPDPTDPPDPEYGTIASPSYLRTAHVADGSVTMRWAEISGAAGYILSRSDSPEGPFEVVATVGDQVWATDTTVDTTEVNYYRVQSRPATGLPSVPSRVAVASLTGDAHGVELPADGVLSFDLGNGALADGAIAIDETTEYTAETRYGFVDVSKVTATDRGTSDPVRSDFVEVGATDFVVDLPNGDYNVSIVAGDAAESSSIELTVETMTKVQTTSKNAGEYLEMTFPIALVDGQLNIEFGGDAPKLNQLIITKLDERSAGATPTVWVTGDSTVQSYTSGFAPQAGWGQMIDRFLDDGVTVNNHAIGGRSSKNFISQGRLDEVLRNIRPGDYLYVQFGHNDNSRGVDDRWAAPLDYKNYLRTFIDGAEQRGATPIIVTPVSRRSFDPNTGIFNVSFPEYVNAAKAIAEETGVPMVDLSSSSREYLNEVGPEFAKSVFLHVPAGVYPGRPNGTVDDTHFQEYGAIQMARLVAADTAKLDIPLASHVTDADAADEAPAAPTGLAASNVTNSSALLSWNAAEGADIYLVYRKLAEEDDSAYTLVGSSTVSPAAVAGMVLATSYDFVVVAVNGAGESEYSNVVTITTRSPLFAFDFQGPGNPVEGGYLEVTPGTTYTAERGYGWTGTLPAANAFRDRANGSNLLRDFMLPGFSNTFVVDLAPGTYSVNALFGDWIGTARLNVTIEGINYGNQTGGRESLHSKVMQPVTVLDGQLTLSADGWLNGLEITPLGYAPANLVLDGVSIDGGDVEVSLSWDAAQEAASYKVYRKTEGATSAVAIGTSGDVSYVDTTAAVGQKYEYFVVSIDANGQESVASNVLEVTTVDPDIPTAPAPEGLRVTSEAKNLVSLAWDEVEDALFYQVFRAKSADGELELIGSAEGPRFDDTDVLTTIPFYYAVVAVNAGGASELSEIVASAGTTVLKRQAENLDRAPVAVATDDGVYIGWRLLGLDPQNLGFYVYRDGARVNSAPITDTTNVLDPAGTVDSTYRIASVSGGTQHWVTESFTVWDDQTFDVALDKPADAYTKDGQPYSYRANDVSVGDVDGDGEYELIVKWDPTNSRDNSQAGYTGNVYIDGYKLDGTKLWRIDLGVNIRAGAHYTQFQVFDYDGDGRAEVVMKTADGTVDGVGDVIGNPSADYRNSSGYVLDGPEFLTIFNGETGAAIDTIDYTPPRGSVSSWGDAYGNRVDRFLAGTAYLDGEHPSVVMARGYYTRTVLAAYDFDGEQLSERWVFDTNDAGSQYEHQGNHQLSVADVDGDQKDEIVYGAITIDDDGTVLYNTNLGHGDALHVSDLDPNRPGLEVFGVHESPGSNGNLIATFRDAGTGEILWSVPGTRDTGRGAAGDIDPRYAGAEAWNISDGGEWNTVKGFLHAADGTLISNNIPAANFVTWWDGDLLREIGDHAWDGNTRNGVPTISKWDYENEQSVEIYRAEGTLTNNDTKGNVALQADLFGDWREEIVTRLDDSSALRIATTIDLTAHRLRTLQSDPVYRLGVAWQNTGYNQPPHTSYFLGEGMATPPAPSITYVGSGVSTPELTKPVVTITSGGGEASTADPVVATGTASPGDTGWKEDKAVVYAELQNSAGAKVVGMSVPVTDGEWSATFDVSGFATGSYTIKVSASSKGMGNGSATAPLTLTSGREPGPATGVPGQGVLTNDNWDGDGEYVVTMNMWWGQNAWAIDLYEDGTLVQSTDLTDATPQAQSASFAISGKGNGSYVYTAVLSNQHGEKSTLPMTVNVTTANPGDSVLSHDNWDGDGSYKVTMNMWWGTNATSVKWYENGTLVSEQPLVANGRNAQSATLPVSGKWPGVYTYRAVLVNAQGETASAPLSVLVNRP